jgi:hypothetical protein
MLTISQDRNIALYKISIIGMLNIGLCIWIGLFVLLSLLLCGLLVCSLYIFMFSLRDSWGGIQHYVLSCLLPIFCMCSLASCISETRLASLIRAHSSKNLMA